MKLMFCENCGDVVTPHRQANFPKFCECNGSCCWWIDPKAGQFGVWSHAGRKGVAVIGIHNSFLTAPFPNTVNETQQMVEFGCLQRVTMEHILDDTPNSYLFKQLRSLIVKFRPGFSSDTVFATAPPGVAPEVS
jgi:hypothetical protein